jgi:uncharacterized protein
VQRLQQRFKTALVTGASGGLGRAFTEMLLAHGIVVWGTARDPVRLGDLCRHPNFRPLTLDLADANSVGKAIEQLRLAEPVELLVNNAGYGYFASFTDVAFSEWERNLQGNLLGPLRLSHQLLGEMLARRTGCIVNVSSMAVEFPLPFMSAYNIAKAALGAFSESLIFETRGTGVTVIDFRPGDYRTSFNQSMHASQPGLHQTRDARAARCWKKLEANLAAAPGPDRAARDLERALLAGRSGTVYSGSFFQARLALLFSRLAPSSLRRAIAARYFGAG